MQRNSSTLLCFDTALYTFFFWTEQQTFGNLSISYIENSSPLFPSLTSFSFYSIFHCVAAHWNLGCVLTFVFRTNATVSYLVHTSFLCSRYTYGINSCEVGKLFPNSSQKLKTWYTSRIEDRGCTFNSCCTPEIDTRKIFLCC